LDWLRPAWRSRICRSSQFGFRAKRWLAQFRAGQSVDAFLAAEAAGLESREKMLEAYLATDPSHALG
jgi:hypothetical protein